MIKDILSLPILGLRTLARAVLSLCDFILFGCEEALWTWWLTE